MHLPNESPDVRVNGRPTGPSRTRLPSPVESKASPVPADHRVRRDNLHRLAPSGPHPRKHDPDEPVEPTKAQPDGRLAPKNRELTAQRQVLCDEFRLRTACGTKGAEQGDDERDHRGRQGYWPPHRSAMETGRFEYSVGTRVGWLVAYSTGLRYTPPGGCVLGGPTHTPSSQGHES